MVPGIVRIFEQEVNSGGKRYKSRIIESVGAVATLKRFELVPDPTELNAANEKKVWIEDTGVEITSTVDGGELQYTYYKVSNGRLFIVGTAKSELLLKAFPVLAAPTGEMPASWLYSGEITVMGAPAPTLIEGEAKARKPYKFKGREYPAIESKAKFAFQLGGGIEAMSEQVSVYAKGIGLVEFSETGRIGKEVTKVSRKLIQIDTP